jgi:hypothetical protein
MGVKQTTQNDAEPCDVPKVSSDRELHWNSILGTGVFFNCMAKTPLSIYMWLTLLTRMECYYWR